MSRRRSSRSRHSRSPSNDWAKRSLLVKLNKSSLRKLGVTIITKLLVKRDDESENKPIQMDMDDPEAICRLVHKRREAYTPDKLFGKNIKVNQNFPDDRKETTTFTKRLRPGEYRPGHPDLALRERHVFYRSPSPEKFSQPRHPDLGTRERRVFYRSPSSDLCRSLEESEPSRPGEYRPGCPDLSMREERVLYCSPSPERSRRSRSRTPDRRRNNYSPARRRQRRRRRSLGSLRDEHVFYRSFSHDRLRTGHPDLALREERAFHRSHYPKPEEYWPAHPDSALKERCEVHDRSPSPEPCNNCMHLPMDCEYYEDEEPRYIRKSYRNHL